MQEFTAGGKHVSIFPSDDPNAPMICLNTFAANEGPQILKILRENGCPALTLVVISNLNWNRDMAPWDCPAVFKKSSPCTGGADDYLHLLDSKILPAAQERAGLTPCWSGIAGYSLAGLFALYALYQTSRFSRAASMSGSLWFPGIKDYLFSHRPKRLPECLYFSLGEKESQTRHPLLHKVLQNTREIQQFYQDQDILTTFRLHPGNHYDHTAERTADGIIWMVQS